MQHATPPGSDPDQLQPQSSRSGQRELLDGLKQGVLLGLAILALTLPPPFRGAARPGSTAGAALSGPVAAAALPGPAVGAAKTQPAAARFANFAGEEASAQVRHIANWVVDSGDNRQLFFVIIDKRSEERRVGKECRL